MRTASSPGYKSFLKVGIQLFQMGFFPLLLVCVMHVLMLEGFITTGWINYTEFLFTIETANLQDQEKNDRAIQILFKN